MKGLYIILIIFMFMFAGCAKNSWVYQGSIVKEERNGTVCYKVYNSKRELLENSCENNWKD